MENSSTKSLSTIRFVIEDTFTKVTSDGEPHGMLTVIAGVSGLLTAFIILAILVSLVAYKKNRKTDATRSKHCKNCSSAAIRNSIQSTSSDSSSIEKSPSSKRASAGNVGYLRQGSSILSLLRRVSSIAEDTINEEKEEARPRLISISCISNGNFEGNLNTAFAGSEFNLSGSFSKKSLEPEHEPSTGAQTQETVIDIHRY